jgi:hypothetical protein
VDRRAPAPAAIQLTILRRGDLNIVDLAEVGSLIPRSETEVDARFLAELSEEMAHLAGAARGRSDAPQGLARQLERVGGLVFSHLLTEPARKRLRDSPPGDLHLRLDEQLVHVPWELCHDGTDFLAAKFRVGRQVITTQPIPERRAPPSPLERLRVLLVADPTERSRQSIRWGRRTSSATSRTGCAVARCRAGSARRSTGAPTVIRSSSSTSSTTCCAASWSSRRRDAGRCAPT